MGLIDKILGYGVIKEAEFTKDFDIENNSQLNALEDLLEKVTPESREIVELELLKIRSGLSGERNVYFELKNSRLPLVCLHDIRLEYKGYTGQFDFIVIASEFILVIETKKLFGNITIDNEGNFNREFTIRNRKIKEGIYSPITQNERHVRLLEEYLVDQKLIKSCPVYSLIVIANDKTIVNKKFAKPEVKNLIIKYDQLIGKLKEYKEKNKLVRLHDKYMREIAQAILEGNKPIDYDYINKLGLTLKPVKQEVVSEEIRLINKDQDLEEANDTNDENSVHQTHIQSDLKKYRYTKAKELNYKPYFIFNNNEMDMLITLKPKYKEEFIGIQGFGEKKYEDYGDDIINIIRNRTEKLYEALKSYRLEKSKELGIKAYEIFNNMQMDEIINQTPNEPKQLENIKYFDSDRISRFGQDIINIVLDIW